MIEDLKIYDRTGYIDFDKEINEESVNEFCENFDAFEWCDEVDNIQINFNSVGGEVFKAFNMFTKIYSSKKNVIGVNNGLIASACTWIWLACDVRKAFDFSLTMIHLPFYENSQKEDELLRHVTNSIMTILSHSFNRNKLSEWLKNEKYFDVSELINEGIISKDDVVISDKSLSLKKEQSVLEIYNIVNQHRKNKNTVMTEQNEEVKNEIVEEVKNETQPIITETEINIDEVKDDSKELEELKEMINSLKTEFTKIQIENEELKEKITNSEKVEILNQSHISKDTYSTWMKLEKEEIKNLLSGISFKKSPTISNVKVNKTYSDYTKEELIILAKENPELWIELGKNNK